MRTPQRNCGAVRWRARSFERPGPRFLCDVDSEVDLAELFTDQLELVCDQRGVMSELDHQAADGDFPATDA